MHSAGFQKKKKKIGWFWRQKMFLGVSSNCLVVELSDAKNVRVEKKGKGQIWLLHSDADNLWMSGQPCGHKWMKCFWISEMSGMRLFLGLTLWLQLFFFFFSFLFFFLVTPCCSQGATLQVTLPCHLSSDLSVHGRTPSLCWIDHPPTHCNSTQLNSKGYTNTHWLAS